MLDPQQVDELSRELAALCELGQEMGARAPVPMKALTKEGFEEKLREYLERARKLAEKFGPSTMSVSVGIPWGVQISLTWPTESQPSES